MRSDMKGPASGKLHCVQKSLVVMTAIDSPKRIVVDRLDSVFESDKGSPANFVEHLDLFFIDAVGPGSDRQTDDVGMIDSLHI